MATNTVTVTGPVVVPNGNSMISGTVKFLLTGWDTDAAAGETIYPEPVFAAIGGDGDFTASLWPNSRGGRGTRYHVSVTGENTSGRFETLLGSVSIPEDGAPHELADLLAAGAPTVNAVYMGLITQDQYDAAIAAASDAETAQAAAEAAQTAAQAAQAAAEAAAATIDVDKLAGIEAGADVTDTANVTAAGALMDSEVTNLAQVKAFDPTDYATAAQGAKADSAQQPPSEGAFVDGDKTKLDGIETAATADQTDSEIETAYNNQVGQVSSGEKTAGTETAVRRFSPKDVADMVGTFRLGRFTSTGQTITSAGLLTLAHGLGVVPGDVRLRLKCTSAEAGYSVNDVIYVDAIATSTTANRSNAIYADTTNIYIRFSDQTSCFATANKSSGVAALLTNSSWDLYVEAIE